MKRIREIRFPITFVGKYFKTIRIVYFSPSIIEIKFKLGFNLKVFCHKTEN